MTQVDGCLECKVCILCCTKHGPNGGLGPAVSVKFISMQL